MDHRKSGKAATTATKDEHITREFVKIYYGILNNHPDQLFQFYGDNSTVIVSEFGNGASYKETADSRESIRQLLKKVFSGITCKIKTAIPQGTVDGGVLLLVSGLLTKIESTSQGGNEHCFTQALVLAPQKNGYYVLNDTLHIMGSLEDEALKWKRETETSGQSGRFYPNYNTRNTIGPVTPRPGGGSTPPNGARRSLSSDDGTRHEKSDSDSDSSTCKEAQQRSRTRPHPPIAPLPGVNRNKPFTTVPPHGPQLNGVPVNVSVGVPPAQPPPGHHQNGNKGGCRPMPTQPGHGVFIARLPFGIQADEVEKAFSLFGPVLNGADGIQVRDGRNGCYAFVTFENCSSAAEAIEKGAIVQGKRVYVEPRYQRQDQVEQKYAVPAMAMPPAPRTGMPQMTPPPMMPQMTPN